MSGDGPKASNRCRDVKEGETELSNAMPPREIVLGQLYAAVLSDVMDELGLTDRAARPFIRPLQEHLRLFGQARTGVYAPVFHRRSEGNPYDLEIDLVDSLAEGEIAVLACQGPSERIAPWGEILSTAAGLRGGGGCFTDGLVRDIAGIRALDFPVFHGGIAPLNSAGRAEIVAIDVPVVCAGVLVEPGDYVFGDGDGVVVVPKARAAEVFSIALERARRENHTREELHNGLSLRQVYDKYGVL